MLLRKLTNKPSMLAMQSEMLLHSFETKLLAIEITVMCGAPLSGVPVGCEVDVTTGEVVGCVDGEGVKPLKGKLAVAAKTIEIIQSKAAKTNNFLLSIYHIHLLKGYAASK